QERLFWRFLSPEVLPCWNQGDRFGEIGGIDHQEVRPVTGAQTPRDPADATVGSDDHVPHPGKLLFTSEVPGECQQPPCPERVRGAHPNHHVSDVVEADSDLDEGLPQQPYGRQATAPLHRPCRERLLIGHTTTATPAWDSAWASRRATSSGLP